MNDPAFDDPAVRALLDEALAACAVEEAAAAGRIGDALRAGREDLAGVRDWRTLRVQLEAMWSVAPTTGGPRHHAFVELHRFLRARHPDGT